MGRSIRRKKADKLDFKKPKLKAGKKKPLAANTTNTSFKSKSIYIHEQLKSQNQNGILSHSKQNLPELLCHLNHYSSSFRCRALIGIKEIMQQNIAIKSYEPGNVITKISKTMVDEDSEVRKACISNFQLLFPELPESKMSPHFSLILSHLYCAMSHLSIDVQKDSLKIVELFLKHYPNLIQRHASTKLLQFFLEMISTKENASKSSNRILVMTFSLKKESAVQWRNRVLSQVYALLKISSYDHVTAKKNRDITFSWDCDTIRLHLIPNIQQPRGVTLENLQRSNVIMSSEPTKRDLMDILLPLLFQCWLEACASGILKKNADTVRTMALVLSIAYLLCKDVYESAEDKSDLMRWLRGKYLPAFNKFFFNCFPFEQPEENQFQFAKKKLRISNDSVKASEFVNINLMVCNLNVLLGSEEFDVDNDVDLATLNYLSELLSSSVASLSSIDSRHIEIIISCLETLFRSDNTSDEFVEVLSNLYTFSVSRCCSRLNKGRIMQLMIMLYQRCSSFQNNNVFEKFLNDLPSHFCSTLQDYSKQTCETCKLDQESTYTNNLKSILACARRALQKKDSCFLESLSRSFSYLVHCIDENCAKLFCSSNCLECVNLLNLSVACFLPHLPKISENDFASLASLCCNQQMNVQGLTFIVDVLVQKIVAEYSGFTTLGADEIVYFLRFLFSVLLAGSKESQSTVGSVGTSDLAMHDVICDHVCYSLLHVSKFNHGLWKVVNAFLQRKIKIISVEMNKKCVMGLLKLARSLIKQDYVPVDFFRIGWFLSSYSLSCANKPSSYWDERIKPCVIDLLRNQCIIESYIKRLTSSDSANASFALTKLLEISDLHELCNIFSSTILAFVKQKENIGDSTVEFRKLKSIVSIRCMQS